MAGEKRLSQRDETLIKILERLSDEIREQQLQLDDFATQQLELSANMERSNQQYNSRHDVTNAAIERSQESIQRYRSDLLSLVNEQDRMSQILSELSKKQTAIAYSQDNISNILANVAKQLETQVKDVRDANAFSVRQGETLSKDIAGLGRNVAKLHMDTEKRSTEMHQETQQRLEKTRIDVERRLLALDKIEASLDVLLIRTEPPEKKPFFVIRIIRRLRLFAKNVMIRRIEKKETLD